jgi:hypothetical protein
MADQYCAERRDDKSLKSLQWRSPVYRYDRICMNLPKRPYNRGIAPTTPEEAAKKPPRKVDLRKLSEEIKQGKILPKHQK